MEGRETNVDGMTCMNLDVSFRSPSSIQLCRDSNGYSIASEAPFLRNFREVSSNRRMIDFPLLETTGKTKLQKACASIG